MSDDKKGESLTPVVLIQQIKNAQFDPRLLKKAERQVCVEILRAEGISKLQIADILKCSTKTIQRDVNEICMKHSLKLDHKLIQKCLGQLEMATNINRDHLMRLARDKNVSGMERVQAENCAWKILYDKFKFYKSTGLFDLNRNDSTEKKSETNMSKSSANNSRESMEYKELTEEELRKRVVSNTRILIKYGELSPEDLKELSDVINARLKKEDSTPDS